MLAGASVDAFAIDTSCSERYFITGWPSCHVVKEGFSTNPVGRGSHDTLCVPFPIPTINAGFDGCTAGAKSSKT